MFSPPSSYFPHAFILGMPFLCVCFLGSFVLLNFLLLHDEIGASTCFVPCLQDICVKMVHKFASSFWRFYIYLNFYSLLPVVCGEFFYHVKGLAVYLFDCADLNFYVCKCFATGEDLQQGSTKPVQYRVQVLSQQRALDKMDSGVRQKCHRVYLAHKTALHLGISQMCRRVYLAHKIALRLGISQKYRRAYLAHKTALHSGINQKCRRVYLAHKTTLHLGIVMIALEVEFVLFFFSLYHHQSVIIYL